MGEFVYSAQGDAPDDADLSRRLLWRTRFLRALGAAELVEIPILKNTLTDTHFRNRDRMGRTLVFLARIVQDGWSSNPREIAVEERGAVLLEPNGAATVVGSGPAYFLQVTQAPAVCKPNEPLTFLKYRGAPRQVREKNLMLPSGKERAAATTRFRLRRE